MYSLAFMAASTIVVALFGAAILSLRSKSNDAAAAWGVALVLGMAPFAAFPRVAAYLGDDEAGKAMLGFFYGASIFSLACFRAVEACVGTTPRGADASLAEYVLYFTASCDPIYESDTGTPKPSPSAQYAGHAR